MSNSKSKFTDISFIHTTFRAALVGSWLLLALYGFVTSQVYTYYTSFPNDDIYKKSLVGLIWVMITAHACFSLHAVDNYLVENMFNPLGLARNVWSLNTSVLIHVVTVAIVMLYFVHNIWCISPKKWRWPISVAILVPVFAHLGFGFLTVEKMFTTESLMDFHTFHRTAFLPMATLQVLADVMIATALCLLLREKRSPFARTQSILRTLMIYAINRCILTSTVVAVEMFALAIDSDAMWYVACEFLTTDLYATSLITTLNARKSLRGNNTESEASQMNSYHLSGIRFETETVVSGGSVGGGRVMNIQPIDRDIKAPHDLEIGVSRPFAVVDRK